MICGGAEAGMRPLAMAGFCAMRAVSLRNDEPRRGSRPWDSDRDGFVLGEGAGVFVIEERQHALGGGVEPIAELVGYARNSDAYHANAPLESGEGVRRVMKLALADAAVPPSEIGYLNAHATSTPLGDRAEAAALRKMFNDHACPVAVSSTKSQPRHPPLCPR